jgi:uncharacterized protein (TIGR03437 family)
MDVWPAQPGIFKVVHGTTGDTVSADNPTTTGESVVIYATGLGATQTVQVDIGGTAVAIDISGPAADTPGLYMVNATVPADAPSGAVPLKITAGGAGSQTVNLAVR